MPTDDAAELQAAAMRLLGDRDAVSVAELLDEAGDWPTGRRLVAEMVAIHHHSDLGFERPGGAPGGVAVFLPACGGHY